jgi:hypothetical protein
MSWSSYRPLLCVATVAIIAGCGGSSSTISSGGGTSNPTVVTYSFAYGAPPVAVAAQIGSGQYTSQTLASGKFTLEIPSGETNFAVAYVCPSLFGNDPTENFEYIQQTSISDGVSYYEVCPGLGSTIPTGLATAKIDPSAFPAGNFVGLASDSLAWSSGILNFQEQLTTGTYDIPVTVSTVQGGDSTVLAAKILRAQTVPGALNGGATITFSPSDATTLQTATFSNAPAGANLFGVNAAFFTGSGAYVDLTLSHSPNQFLVMPSGTAQSGDYYLIGEQASSNGSAVGVQLYTSSTGSVALSFPAAWSYAGPAAAKLPTFHFTYPGFAGLSNLTRSASIVWNQGDSVSLISVVATAEYQGQSTSMTIPDLSTIPGFVTPAASGTYIEWNAEILQGLQTVATTPSGTLQNVSNSGTYIEP